MKRMKMESPGAQHHHHHQQLHLSNIPTTTTSSSSMLPKMSVPELLKSSCSPTMLPHHQQHQHHHSAYSNPLAHLMSLSAPGNAAAAAAAAAALSPLASLAAAAAATTSPQTPTSVALRGTLHPHHEKHLSSSYTPSPLAAAAADGSGGHHHRRRITHHDRGNPNLDPEEDLAKNREFYRVQDVRPPYTYAALIRAVSFAKLHFLQNHWLWPPPSHLVFRNLAKNPSKTSLNCQFINYYRWETNKTSQVIAELLRICTTYCGAKYRFQLYEYIYSRALYVYFIRRRIKTEEKAKVIDAVCLTELIQSHVALHF